MSEPADASPVPSAKSIFYTVAVWGGGIALIALLGWLMYVLGESSRQNDRATNDGRDFKNVGLALFNYLTATKRFPYAVCRKGEAQPGLSLPRPPGDDLFSWRFTIIPYYISNRELGGNRDVAWDHPANAKWRATGHPFGYDELPESSRPESPLTRVFAITGRGTVFGDGETELPGAPGGIPSSAIVLVEVRNSGVEWMQPGDFDIATMPRTIQAPDGKGISSRDPNGFLIMFGDGSVHRLKYEIPFDLLSKFFTVDGARKHAREELEPYFVK